MDDFFEILWTDGVIGRLVPDDRGEETAARVALGKAVWLPGKDDPELYRRILYANEKIKTGIERHYTIAGGSQNFVAPAQTGLARTFYEQEKMHKLFPSHGINEAVNPTLWLLDKLAERSRQELRRLHADADRPLIPLGATGIFHGFQVTVEAYSDDGGIWFKGKTGEDHMGLYQWLKDGGVSPSEVDPKDFHLPEEEK